ncbi:hypothetical protein ABZ951_08820 [Streptomyces sp. NPDC046215]
MRISSKLLECTCPTPSRKAAPAKGTYVVDTRHDRVGEVMGHEGPRLQLRPPAGGREWEAHPDVTRPVTHTELSTHERRHA